MTGTIETWSYKSSFLSGTLAGLLGRDHVIYEIFPALAVIPCEGM